MLSRRRIGLWIGCLAFVIASLMIAPHRTISAQADPPVTPPVLFRSDFSTRAERWRLLDMKKAAIRYMDAGLQVSITPANYALWSLPDNDLKPEQVDIQLTGTWVAGAEDAEFGIVLQYRGDNDLQVVTLSRAGKVRVGLIGYGVFTDQIAPVQATLDPATPATLRAIVRKVAKQATLDILVNGEKAVTTPLPASKAGRFGVYAQSGTASGFEVILSEFTVAQPQ